MGLDFKFKQSSGLIGAWSNSGVNIKARRGTFLKHPAASRGLCYPQMRHLLVVAYAIWAACLYKLGVW